MFSTKTHSPRAVCLTQQNDGWWRLIVKIDRIPLNVYVTECEHVLSLQRFGVNYTADTFGESHSAPHQFNLWRTHTRQHRMYAMMCVSQNFLCFLTPAPLNFAVCVSIRRSVLSTKQLFLENLKFSWINGNPLKCSSSSLVNGFSSGMSSGNLLRWTKFGFDVYNGLT